MIAFSAISLPAICASPDNDVVIISGKNLYDGKIVSNAGVG